MNDAWILFSDPDISQAELDAVQTVLVSPRLSMGAQVEAFEAAFAAHAGRRQAVAVASGTLGLACCLAAQGIGAGDEVVLSPYAWHQIGQVLPLLGIVPVFADIDYWSGTLSPASAAARIGPRTRAILAGNINGHPADWDALRALATAHGLLLLEDSTEAIGSRYRGRRVGGFGDCAIFDFSQPGPLCCGEGGMLVTDDDELAHRLRYHRARRRDERFSLVASLYPAWQSGMSEWVAALGRVQLERIGGILARRRQIEVWYYDHMKSFEGIKDPYVAPEADEVHWFQYVVHLGTRFTRSSRDAIVEDLRAGQVEAAAYCQPLHLQRYFIEHGARKGLCPVVEKVADRSLTLPFHGHLNEDQVAFIVQTAKDASINVGAGSAIYL